MRYVLTVAVVLAAIGLGCEQQKPDPQQQPNKPMTTAKTPEPVRRLPPPMVEPVRPVDDRVGPQPLIITPPTPAGSGHAAGIATPPAGGSVYVVKKGDTLWAIAKRQLGDGKRHKEILALNPGLTPSAMKIGQSLKMPPH
jgi:nucleoid-associated protein YgaU